MARYISCSCNRTPHCADWSSSGFICFGTCNAIAIYEPDVPVGRVLHTLHQHRDHVTTVRWIKSDDGVPEWELLSSSVDGTIIVWSKDHQSNTFRHTSVLDASSTVTFADSLHLSDDGASLIASTFPKLLICASTTAGELKLWSREENTDTRVIETILFGRKLPIHCRLMYLPSTKQPLLAVSLEDASVLLYAMDSDNAPKSGFIKVHSLFGHEDWVRCMDFSCDSDGDLLLATGSQDSTIRLWRISGIATISSSSLSSDKLVQKKEIFSIKGREYNITLESVLCGHEGWVYGVHWQPASHGKIGGQSMRLLSSSLDKSMIIWEMDDTTGIWTEKVRVGEVGGNSLGFYGCKFGPDGLYILAHGYQGSFHIWKYSQDIANWIPLSVPSGHFSEVVDLCWEPKGRFLITAGADQTTRIHAPWKEDLKELWHEIARPQIHGYDMTCLVALTPYMYASGAEEKVVRVFTTTSAFRDRLRPLADMEDLKSVMARSATVPSLGLTNKAMFDEEDGRICENNGEKSTITMYGVYEPPTEEELVRNTLWPELHKLYGHGYEIFCMAARHDGRLLATACKATSSEHSAIILWSTDTWSQVKKLVSHQLTVTQMKFSPNDRYLLSVSRDRRWSMFKEEDDGYALIAASSKKGSLHMRIIWCCDWTPDSDYFATGSRDGKVGVWSAKTTEDKSIIPETSLDTQNQSVTALCFALNRTADGSYVMAIGYETGCIEIQMLTLMTKNAVWSRLVEYDTSQAHHLTVRRLMFRPSVEYSSNKLQLASCSSDHTVKIHDIDLSQLSINV